MDGEGRPYGAAAQKGNEFLKRWNKKKATLTHVWNLVWVTYALRNQQFPVGLTFFWVHHFANSSSSRTWTTKPSRVRELTWMTEPNCVWAVNVSSRTWTTETSGVRKVTRTTEPNSIWTVNVSSRTWMTEPSGVWAVNVSSWTWTTELSGVW